MDQPPAVGGLVFCFLSRLEIGDRRLDVEAYENANLRELKQMAKPFPIDSCFRSGCPGTANSCKGLPGRRTTVHLRLLLR